MRAQPLGEGNVRPLWQQIDDLPTLQVQQEGSIGGASSEGKVVHAEGRDGWCWGQRCSTDSAQDRITARRQCPARPAGQLTQKTAARASPKQESNQCDEVCQAEGVPGGGCAARRAPPRQGVAQ
jgi:hypothetical protein